MDKEKRHESGQLNGGSVKIREEEEEAEKFEESEELEDMEEEEEEEEEEEPGLDEELEEEELEEAVEQEHEEEEEGTGQLAELSRNLEFYMGLLSSIREPLVCEVEARSALVRLSPVCAEVYCDGVIVGSDGGSKERSMADDGHEDDGLQKSVDETLPNATLVAKMLESLNYTLELSSETENKFSQVYTGDANEITLKDLKPNKKYFLR